MPAHAGLRPEAGRRLQRGRSLGTYGSLLIYGCGALRAPPRHHRRTSRGPSVMADPLLTAFQRCGVKAGVLRVHHLVAATMVDHGCAPSTAMSDTQRAV